MASVGTTVEVLAVKEDVDNLTGVAAARIRAIGRQRFKVLSTTRQLGGSVGFFVDTCVCAGIIIFLSRMHVMVHNWSATKQHLHPQSVTETSCHSALLEDSIQQCGTSSGSRRKDTDQCL